ncbi:MAG: hypothetical protein IJL85_01165 [Erysipelotrichaceae bacterium]|nr:hypothetical protein [Erysipelotrichaceae bacterium]
MSVVLEGIAFSFWLLLICVILIKDGSVGGVIFYENDVKERVVELGLITKDEIRKRSIISSIALFAPLLFAVPLLVYRVNGASGFKDAFLQMCGIYLIAGLFDRLFIDWYWVGHTKAWIIPGTEDLQPYIPKKTLIGKWLGTLIGFPLIAAIIAKIVELLF